MKTISEFEKAQFCQQMAMMLDGGIDLASGFDMLAEQVDDKEYKPVLIQIRDNLNNSMTLYACLKETGLYDSYMISMIEVGETSGYLDKVMSQLAIYYTRNNDTRNKIKDALTYPFILICMMLIVIVVLMVKILPLFETVLSNIGVQLSPLSLTLMSVGKWCAIIVMILLIIVVLILAYFFAVVKQRNYSMIEMLEKFFITKNISYNLALAQFAYCLSLLTNSGYDQNAALKMCVDMCDNKVLRPKIAQLSDDLETKSLNEAILAHPIFANTYNRLLIIGNQSGHFEQAIAQVASSYEKEVDNSIDSFMNMIEPILVTVMSVIVGIILLAVMLPLTSIMSSL